MIYRVLFDDHTIYDDDADMAILDPEVTLELNAAGSFQFTLPVSHPFYLSPTILTPDVEVYENDKSIWFGRPLDISIDISGNKVVYCEGALAYFNDSIQREKEYDEISLHEFFKQVIANHNSQVPTNRQFTVGTITVADHMVYRKLDYDKTIDVLSTMCLDTDGGYFFTRRENNVNYIDWIYKIEEESPQPISYALNLQQLNEKVSGSELYTSVLPLGQDAYGNRLTIESVNNGSDYLDTEATEVYGRITYLLQRDDLSTPEKLLEAAQKWIEEQQFSNIVIECEAAELHYLDNSYLPFKLGQNVHVTSTPHVLDATFPIVKMSLRLDEPVKTITIGTIDRKELTSILKDGTGSGDDESKTYFDQTPTLGSGKAVTSSGVFVALGNIRFSLNEDRTVHAYTVEWDESEEYHG